MNMNLFIEDLSQEEKCNIIGGDYGDLAYWYGRAVVVGTALTIVAVVPFSGTALGIYRACQ